MPSTALLDHPQKQLPLETLADRPEALSELLTSIRQHLHRHPELGLREHATSHFIQETLEDYNLSVRGPVAETGLIVDIDGSAPAPRVGYRADIDALPMKDAKDVPYRSTQEGVAHLCGHDAHAAVAIGAALLLHARRDRLAGSPRVFFQPNEESSPSGAPLMIKDGAIDDLEAVYAIHVEPTLESGRYGLRTGAVTAAVDRFEITVHGPGTGHSARPHETVDTIWLATQIIQALHSMTGRLTDARNAAVLAVCYVQGGHAHNVIPSEVSFGGTLRTVNEKDRALLGEKLHQLAQEIASLHDGRAEIEFERGSPPVINEAGAIETVRRTIREARSEEAIYEIPKASMGAEDFAFYLQEIPGALIRVGTQAGPKTRYPLHDNRFDLDETALAPAARLMADVIERRLQEEREREKGGEEKRGRG